MIDSINGFHEYEDMNHLITTLTKRAMRVRPVWCADYVACVNRR